MPCWTWITNRFHQRSLQGSHVGSDALLVMPGPSLKLAAPLIESMDRRGAVVIGCNTSFPAVRPDVWVGCDHPECYDPSLMYQPFPKIMGNAYAEKPWRGRRIKQFPNTLFIDRDPRNAVDLPTNAFAPSRLGAQPFFVWGWTFFTAIHVAAWLGCRRIYLVGADLNVEPLTGIANLELGAGYIGEKKDGAATYSDDRHLENRLAEINRRGMGIQLAWLKDLREVGSANGYELITTGETSGARAYLPYVPLAEAIKRIGRRADGLPMIEPSPDRRVHGLLANQASWGETPAEGMDFGVITGTDKTTEWRLRWWFDSVRKNYDGPVAFADFGMSDEGRAWCEQRGLVVDCRGTYLPGWHNKPVAMMRVPWRKALWLDTDCEVMERISGVGINGDMLGRRPMVGSFDTLEIGPSGYAAAEDGLNPSDVGHRPVNTGVVLFRHGCEAIKTWARSALTDPSRARGDQELLNRLLDDRMVEAPAVIPAKYNGLRLAPWTGAERVVHWTGKAGDAWIRASMNTLHGRAGEMLSRLPAGGGTIAEVGVLDGRTSRVLLQDPRVDAVAMVDSWAEDAAGGGGQKAFEWAMKYTEFAADRRFVLRGDSVEMAEKIGDGALDLVFLDGDHMEFGTLRDIAAWAPKLKPGGVLGGHDIDHEDYPEWGVRRAVERWMEDNGYEASDLELGKDHTWWIVIRAAVDGSDNGAVAARSESATS